MQGTLEGEYTLHMVGSPSWNLLPSEIHEIARILNKPLNQYLKALAVIYPQEGMFLPPRMLIVSERIQKPDRKLYDSQGALGTQKRSPSPPADQAEEEGLGKHVEEVTWADQFQVPIALHPKSFGIFFPLTLSAVISWQVKLTSTYLSTLSCLTLLKIAGYMGARNEFVFLTTVSPETSRDPGI